MGHCNLESGTFFSYYFFDNFLSAMFSSLSFLKLDILNKFFISTLFFFSVIYPLDYLVYFWGDLFDLPF